MSHEEAGQSPEIEQHHDMKSTPDKYIRISQSHGTTFMNGISSHIFCPMMLSKYDVWKARRNVKIAHSRHLRTAFISTKSHAILIESSRKNPEQSTIVLHSSLSCPQPPHSQTPPPLLPDNLLKTNNARPKVSLM